MKYLATITLFVVLLVFCDSLNFGEENLNADLEIENTKISKVSDIEATFTVKNETDKTKGYGFSSGCQVSYLITLNGSKRFKADGNLVCTQALSGFELAPQETKKLKLPTYFDTNLEPGNYTIKAYLIGYEDEVYATESFVVN